MRRDTSCVFMHAVRHQYQGGNKMNDRKEIPRELLEKILANTHTDSPRPTFMSQGMGSVLGLWQCSCGFMASGNFCEQCGAPIAIRLKIQTKSSHKIHRSELLRLDFVNLNSWIAIKLFLKLSPITAPPFSNFCRTLFADFIRHRACFSFYDYPFSTPPKNTFKTRKY